MGAVAVGDGLGEEVLMMGPCMNYLVNLILLGGYGMVLNAGKYSVQWCLRLLQTNIQYNISIEIYIKSHICYEYKTCHDSV